MLLPTRAHHRRFRLTCVGGLAAVFPLLAIVASAAHAQSSLELPLETGQEPTAQAPAPQTPAPKPAATPAKAAAKGKAKGSRMTSLPLPSRGGASRTPVRAMPQQAPSKVLAQLGLVMPDQIEVRVSRDLTSQALSVVPKGTYLAVVQEDADFWGVLMVNNTIGWVPKTAIELVDYRTEVALAPTTPKPTASSGGSDRLTEGLDPTRQAILREAFTYLGVPYVWAGNTRAGLDCSAFVKGVFSTVGVKLPRVSADQATVGIPVQGPDLRPGDRLYFDMKHVGRVSHTGIYLGNGLFIHASSNQGKVGVDSIFKSSYYNALVAARRDFE